MKISEIVSYAESFVMSHKRAFLHGAGYVAVYLAGSHHLLAALLKALFKHASK